MKKIFSVFIVGSLFALSACGGQKFTATGSIMPPRAEGCDFRILTTAPTGSYEELGIIDVNGGAYGTNVTTNIADFKEKIAPLVCKAGGNAALVAVNGLGMYVKATVLNLKSN